MSLDRRHVAIWALITLCATSVVNLGMFVASAWFALGFPYDLDYGEGIVWQQMTNIFDGNGYAPLGMFPAIVYHYPPVYHLIVGVLVRLSGLDPLFAGRLVSVVAAVASMLSIACFAYLSIGERAGRRTALAAATLGGLSFAGSSIVLSWSSVMRVDMLACALTLAGLLLAARSHIAWAALVFALAVYTKQTAIAGPAAAFVALWIARPRAAWTFLAICGGIGLAAMTALMIATHGEFARHILLYNVNRFDPSRWYVLRSVAAQAAFVTCGFASAFFGLQRLRKIFLRDFRRQMTPADVVLLMAMIYLIIRTVLILTVFKSGSSTNYFIDLFSILAVFLAHGIVRIVGTITKGGDCPYALLFVIIAIFPIQAYRLQLNQAAASDTRMLSDRAALVSRIAQATKPVISDNMVLLIRAGKPVLFEPAIVAELAHSGLYDEPSFVKRTRNGDFAFFITEGERGETPFDERYNPPVAEAIDAAYPRKEHYRGIVLHLPR